jgi:hypothetical protein
MRRYAAWLNGLTTSAAVARDLFVEAPLCHPASAIRAAALARAGGWRQGPFPEDYDLWLRLAAAGGALANVPRRVLDWREGASRLTRTDPRYALPRHVALKCAFLGDALGGAREVVLWGAGPTGRAFADGLRAQGVSVAAFLEVDAKKIGGLARGVRVHAFGDAPRFRGTPILVAVGAPGARDLIRAELARMGFAELRDYRCVS